MEEVKPYHHAQVGKVIFSLFFFSVTFTSSESLPGDFFFFLIQNEEETLKLLPGERSGRKKPEERVFS